MAQESQEQSQAPYKPNYTGDAPVNALLLSTFSAKHGAAISESLGPEAIAGHLSGEFGLAVQVDHIDLQLDPDLDALTQSIAENPPQILGVSVKIGALEQTEALLDHIDAIPFAAGKKPLIVMGGVVPTFATIDMLKRYPDVIMAVKEGENAAAGLVDYIRGDKTLDQVPGIWYMNPDHTRTLHTRERRLNLAQRHLPARITSERIYSDLGGMVWIEGSRGCDFNCTFCSIRQLHGGGFDGAISPESVVADLANLNKLGIQAVSFTDDDFGGDPERTFQLAKLIQEQGLQMRFSISTRADHIWQERTNFRGEKLSDQELALRNKRLREIMQELHAAGLERVFIGMESGSPTQLRRYGKQVTVDGNYKALEILSEIGIDVVAGYIPIDPAMSLLELQENLDFLRRTGMYKKITNPLSVLRIQEGSPYLDLARNRGLVAEKTEDLVFYKAKFQDPSVQRVAELADRWVEDMYILIFGLKGEVASQTLLLGRGVETQSSRVVETALHQFRELEMSFIEAITARLRQNPDANLNQILEQFHAQRQVLINDVVSLTQSGVIGKNPRLLEAIDHILKPNNNG